MSHRRIECYGGRIDAVARRTIKLDEFVVWAVVPAAGARLIGEHALGGRAFVIEEEGGEQRRRAAMCGRSDAIASRNISSAVWVKIDCASMKSYVALVADAAASTLKLAGSPGGGVNFSLKAKLGSLRWSRS